MVHGGLEGSCRGEGGGCGALLLVLLVVARPVAIRVARRLNHLSSRGGANVAGRVVLEEDGGHGERTSTACSLTVVLLSSQELLMENKF